MSLSPIVIAVTTIGSSSRAHELAEGAVIQKLAVCAQVEGPIQSHYIWNDSLNCDKEYRVVFKTRMDCIPELETWVRRNHSYDLPQWLVWQVDHASEAYANWLNSSLKGTAKQPDP
ncbi:MAG: divalent-cation tolerance protein CutA [Verrucomicrobia bacterium]|nr:divalent-cation tolerance protein CutA [Verrucomicrobiota bacterium]